MNTHLAPAQVILIWFAAQKIKLLMKFYITFSIKMNGLKQLQKPRKHFWINDTNNLSKRL